MADEYEFDDDQNDEDIDEDIDDEDEDSDEDIDDDIDDEDDEDEDEEEEENDDDGEDSVELSTDTAIPLVADANSDAVEVDEESLSETEPADIPLANWEELLGKDFDFEDLIGIYGDDSIYEIEIGVDYAEAA